MADKIPCPNPACTHVFALAQLQGSAAVTCPRCGFRMQGRGGKAPPAAPPVAPAVAPPVGGAVMTAQVVSPPAAKTKPAQPRTAPTPPRPAPKIDVSLVTAPPPASPAARTVTLRADGARTLVRMFVILGVLGFSLCGVPTLFILAMTGFGFFSLEELWSGQLVRNPNVRSGDYQPFVGNARTQKGGTEKAFKLLLARNSWEADKDLKNHLDALGAFVNKQDDLWLAVAVQDYGMQKPRDGELIQSAMERLDRRFGESLELAAKAEPADFAGTPAQKLVFKGTYGAVVWWGECIMFTHHGFGYWLFLGAPAIEDVQPLETELKNKDTGFSIATDRTGWREQPPKTETFVASDNLLTLTAPEGVWDKATAANVEFATGTLVLLGRYLKEKDNQKNAHLQTFTLDKQGDLKEAMSAAQKYLEDLRKEQNAGYKLGPANEGSGQSELGVVEDVGNRRGRIAEMMLSLNDQPTRYYLVAVVSEADRATVVLCECNWKSRQIWRGEFLSLLKTLKMRGSK
jgi:hypothetical protein